VLAEIAKRDAVPGSGSSGPRNDDLAAVGYGGDTRDAVNVEPGVVVLVDARLTGVNAHPHAKRQLREGPLRVERPADGVCRVRERDEERVAFGAEHDAAPGLDGIANQPPLLDEQLQVRVPVLAEIRGRALDVGEQEGDGSFREPGRRRIHGLA
jgi:hypothetical protein